MSTIHDIITKTLDIGDLPQDLQEDVIGKTGEGIMQSVMIHAFMTLPLEEQHELMKKLDHDEDPASLFAWLDAKLPDFKTVLADALARYITA